MKLAFLFSEHIFSTMEGHVRNLFYHPDITYIFPYYITSIISLLYHISFSLLHFYTIYININKKN